MTRHHQFRFARPPRLGAYLPTAGTLALAVGLTAVAIVTVLDPNQRSGNAFDDYGIWFVAAASWATPIVFGLGIWRRIRAYHNGEPAIAVDDTGITLRGWTGRPLDLKWSEVADLELEHRSSKSALLIRAGSVSGAASLDDLHVHPMGVWGVVKRCRERGLA